jgi:hypothetical protein
VSLLTIVQQALGEIGFSVPSTVVGNSDGNATQAFYLANRAGQELQGVTNAADYWPVIRKQYLFNLLGIGPFNGTFTSGSNLITNCTFTGTGTGLSGVQVGWQISSQYAYNDTMVESISGTTVTMSQASSLSYLPNNVAQSQTDSTLAFGQEAYPLPADIDYFIPNTGWDRNFRWQLLGPITAQEWQVIKSGISPVGPRLRYRLMENQIYVNPAPYVPTGQSSPISDLIVMEYVSKYWAAPAGTVSPTQPTQAAFQLDTDIAMAFPEDLVTKSLKWRMLKAKGQAYAEEYQEFEDSLNRTSGRQTMPRNLPLNAQSTGIRLLNSQNVPDTGFGS